jgi:hypothetical protein
MSEGDDLPAKGRMRGSKGSNGDCFEGCAAQDGSEAPNE